MPVILWMFIALCPLRHALAFQEGDKRLIYESTEKSVPLVELYASDARSSCNKAVEHFNSYKQKDPKTDLWKQFVPIVMHVSLWDIPGHKDIFSKKEFGARLAIHQKNWSVRQVYAPTVVANGLEWSGWARGQNIPMPNRDKAGILKVDGSKKEDMFQVDFVPSKDLEGKSFVVHASLLGFGLRSKPAEGTNQNRSLQHDFVALFLQQQDLKLKDGRHTATVEISRKGLWIKEYAVVFWVSEKDDNRSLQATGGFLPI